MIRRSGLSIAVIRGGFQTHPPQNCRLHDYNAVTGQGLPIPSEMAIGFGLRCDILRAPRISQEQQSAEKGGHVNCRDRTTEQISLNLIASFGPNLVKLGGCLDTLRRDRNAKA